MENVKQKLLSFWNEIKYEACIFLYLYVRMLLMFSGNFIPWCSTYYGVNYSYGIISRGLVGTIFKVAFNGDISLVNAHFFVLISQFVLIILFSCLAGKLIRMVNSKENRKLAIELIALYLIMPFSIIYLFDEQNYGRLDLYLYIITFIQFLLIFKKTNLIRLLCIGILSVICVFIHEGYILYIFPILLAVLVYKLYRNNFNKKMLWCVLGIVFVVLLTSIYFYFFSTINVSSSTELLKDITNETDILIGEDVITYQYYKYYLSEHMVAFFKDNGAKNIAGLFLSMILLGPINYVLYEVTNNIFKVKTSNLKRYTFGFIQTFILAYFLICFTTSDWGRWFAAMYTFQIIFLILLSFTDENNFFKIINDIKKKIGNAKIVFLSYLLFVVSFGPFQHAGIFSKFIYYLFYLV